MDFDLINVLQTVLYAVLVIASPILFVWLFRFIKEGILFLKVRVENRYPEQYDMLYGLAVEAVAFAEQKGIGKLGKEKLEMAIEYLQRELDVRGFDEVDVSVLADKIEAALQLEWNRFVEELKPVE